MDKRNRRYQFTHINKEGVATIVTLPFTIEFDIERKNWGASNLGQVRLYNLSKETREKFRKDQIQWSQDEKVILTAGYDNNLSVILNMFVSQAWSVRQGVDFITQLQCLDGGYAYVNAKILGDITFGSGTKQRDAIVALAKDLEQRYGVQTGSIGTFDGTFQRGASFTGNHLEAINEISGGAAFIDNNTLHVLNDKETVSLDPLVITPESGLLNTPLRQLQAITFEMIFEPQLQVGRKLIMQSFTGDKDINGEYIVRSFHHRGIISDAVSGDARTDVECYLGDFEGIPSFFTS